MEKYYSCLTCVSTGKININSLFCDICISKHQNQTQENSNTHCIKEFFLRKTKNSRCDYHTSNDDGCNDTKQN